MKTEKHTVTQHISPSATETWEFLVAPGSFRSVHIGPSTVAISAVCLLGLAGFSIFDFREMSIVRREESLKSEAEVIRRNEDEMLTWLQTKEENLSRHLAVLGDFSSELAEEQPKEAASVENKTAAIRAIVDRLEARARALTDVATEDEEKLWYLPTIAPVALTEEFMMATGPLTRSMIKNGLSGISSQYGIRFHPIHKQNQMHYGLDIFCPVGTGVRATANGKVLFAGSYNSAQDNLRQGYGQFVVIEHGNTGIQTFYAHLSKVAVTRGQIIQRGESIAYSGSSGSSTAPHLHYEVVRNGTRVNPINYIRDVPLVEEGKKVLYVKKEGRARTKRRAG